MKINKKIGVCLAFFVLAASGLLFIGKVLADGGIMIWPPTIHVQQTDQNAIVAWNGTQELLILSTNLTKPAGSGQATLLHVVPLPNNPADIKEEDPGVFDKMVALLNEKIAAMQSKGMNFGEGTAAGSTSTNSAAPSVEVVMQKTIGAHDITVVKVNVADDFSNWIDGFASGKNLAPKQISQTFKDGLQSYLKRGINYFAFDVLDLSDQSMTVKPLVYQFDTKYFYFPLLISGISEIGDSLANVNLFLVFNKDWKLPQQIWQNYGDNYSIDDSNLDIGLTSDELKGISARAASIFDGDVKVRRFSMHGTLSAINKDLMLFPRLFSSNLRIGMNNDDVKILQQLLINEGFWNSGASVSSYFGPVTKQAVMSFQQKNSEQILKPLGLTYPTGFFGPYTRNYLNNNIFIDFGTGPSTILCGNGRCDPGETSSSCPADCALTDRTKCFSDADCVKNHCGTSCVNSDWAKTQAMTPCPLTNASFSCACQSGQCVSVPQMTECGNGICDPGETAASCPQDCGVVSDSGKAKCIASGGSWAWTDCGSCLPPATQTARLNQAPGGCAAVCMPEYVCQCPAGNYWASLEEGCIGKITTVCGNGTCEAGETSASCPQDCGKVSACVPEGGSPGMGGHGGSSGPQCCAGLTQIVEQAANGIGGCSWSPAGFDMCSNCGDGICGKYEDYCNCPQDCPNPLCGKEGEIFAGNAKECCAGLNIKCVGPCCNDTGQPVCYSTPNYTCVRSQ